MNARRLVPLLICLALVSVSCRDTAEEEPPEESPCFYLQSYLAVAPQDGAGVDQAVNDALAQLGLEEDAVIDAASVLNATSVEQVGDDHPDFEALQAAGEAIDTVLGFINVGEDDPLAVAVALQDAGINAAPIKLVGMANHIKFAPGTDEVRLSSNPLSEVSPGGDDVVAVVDSGIVAEGPEWLIGSVLRDEIDLEVVSGETTASHGTFVAGIIRQLAPDFRVSMAKARETSVSQIAVSQNHEAPDQTVKPTSELQVFEAIARLIARHQESDIPVVALNLSLGSYGCDSEVVTLQTAIDQWETAFPGAQVFAAGGNEDLVEPFYPAAFDGVTGVGAGDLLGAEIVWTANVPKPAPTRSWTIGNVVPGANIVNMGNSTAAFVWSGSSFASAVAASLYVSGKSLSSQYTDIAGLTFQITPGANEAALHVEQGGEIVDQDSGAPVTLP